MDATRKKNIGIALVALAVLIGGWQFMGKRRQPAQQFPPGATNYGPQANQFGSQPVPPQGGDPALGGQQPNMYPPQPGPQGGMQPGGLDGAPMPQGQAGGLPPQAQYEPQPNPYGGNNPGADPYQAQGPSGGQYSPQSGGTGAGDQLYRDPQGQFSLRVPSGWRTNPTNGGVLVMRGNATAVVSAFQGATSPDQIVSSLSRQYQQQWRDLRIYDQGQFMLSGAQAAYVVATGTSPRGVQSFVRFMGAVQAGQGIAAIITAPLNEFNQVAPVLQSIEGSISLGGQYQ